MKFQYQALQRDGRLVSGLVEAASVRGAHRELLRRGVQPTAIDMAAAAKAPAGRRRRLTLRDYANLFKQLHALIAGGVPIAEAITAVEEAAAHPVLAQSCRELTAGLRRGEAFPSAFARCFPAMPPHIHKMIETGDFSGRLAEALADAAEEFEREVKIRAELRHILLYPAFLVGFGLLAVGFIFLVVVPRFATLFAGNLDRLPLLSYAVIGAGMWFRAHLVSMAAATAAAAAIGVWGLRRPSLRAAAVDLAARLPILRGWLAQVEIARWAAVLARLLGNRLPLVQSLELARSTVRRGDIQLRLGRVERDVRAGAALATALADSAFLTPAALAMIRVGERSGNLAEMVGTVASLCDEAVRNRSRTMLAVIEPVAIVMIGAVIGLVALSVFLAITSINKMPGL